tara:strand:- start:924 stop:1610 length:687 start_codon:yes stop_codon:yes gene_type:complete
MKIWYEHLFGKLDKQDIQFMRVWADVRPEESDEALAQGFIQLEDAWQQVRAVRIHIETFVQKAKQPKTDPDIIAEKIYGSEATLMMPQLMPIYETYLDHHGYTMLEPNPLEDIGHADTVWLYKLHNDLIGFSVWTTYMKSLDNWQMAWNYADFKLQLGKYSLWHEILHAHELGYKWFYLGASYDKSCKWKASIPGFEWWNGKEWSDNKDTYKDAIQKDISFKIEFEDN